MDNVTKSLGRLNICQWNARSLRPKLKIFEQLLIQEKIHIAAVSETWLTSESLLKVSNYNIFRKDREEGYGGVAIFTHKSIQALLCPIQENITNLEIVHVKIFNCKLIQNVVAVYCPPDLNTTNRDWEFLLSVSSKNAIILGDLNCHHTNWSHKIDTRGSQLFDCLLDSNFIVLNDGTHTRIQLVNGDLRKSSPDISIVSIDIAIEFTWHVINETLGSDHFVIKLSTHFERNKNLQIKRNFKRADWKMYHDYLEKKLTNFIFSNNLQVSYDQFIGYMFESADLFIPKFKISYDPESKFKPKPYWNSEISQAVAKRRLALKNFRRNPTPDNFDTLQLKIKESQTLINKAEKLTWQNFCTTVNQNTSARDMWNKMRWLKGNKNDKKYVPHEIAAELLNKLCPDFVLPPQPEFFSDNPQLEGFFCIQELESCIKSKDTSPGSDDISYSMVKNLPSVGKDILLQLYNKIFYSSYVPYQWHDIMVVPIPKQSAEPDSVKSLRPISLISCICKIFHSMLQKRLEWYLEKNRSFSDYTVGFRKSRSSLDGLSRLISNIQIGFCKDLTTVGCFVDIENAYNTVDISVLLLILDKLGVGSKFSNYLWNFLTDRQIKIKINNVYLIRKTRHGLAQGDPLSPLLFNIATIEIMKKISNVNIIQYADDFVLYASARSMDNCFSELQIAMDVLYKLLNNLGLEISASKTKICVFKKSPVRNLLQLEMNNQPLQTVETVKYLGLWLDRAVRWGKHITEVEKKTLKFLNLLKVLAGPGWGMHPLHLRRIYIAVIRSRLDYASFLYDSSCQSLLYRLDKIQNQALRIIGGFIKSTPIHVMESELSLPPLHIRRLYLAGKFWLKSKALINNISILPLCELSSFCGAQRWKRKKNPALVTIHDILKDTPIHVGQMLEIFSLDTWVSHLNIAGVINFNIPSIIKPKRYYKINDITNKCNEFIKKDFYHFYKIYTDGSKDKNNIAAAFFDPQNKNFMKFKITYNCCIMFAELIAIAEAISYLESIENDRCVIFSDSKSALQHLARITSTVRCLPIAYNIISSILSMKARGKNIILQWIPSHANIAGNDEADKLAKEALSEGVTVYYLPFFTDCIYIMRFKIYEIWKEYFDKRSVEKGIWYKTIQCQPLAVPWISNCSMSRNEIVVAFRLRSGHLPLNKFMFLMGKSQSPNCVDCGMVEDAQHVLMECVRNDVDRKRFFNKLNILNVGICNSALANPSGDFARALYKLVNNK